MHTYLKQYQYFSDFRSNANAFGYTNRLFLSNLPPVENITPGKDYTVFLNYDYKNHIEQFPEKNNNPLLFPKKLFIEAEKIITAPPLDLYTGTISAKKIALSPTVTKQEYLYNVNRLKQHIKLGDIYEINYCITFEAQDVCIDPLTLYNKLNIISHAPYASFSKFEHLYIISSSPELFLSKKGDTLITKPIKGTAKRSADAAEDAMLKDRLFLDKKERNENVMIVDVARNDLSRLAKKGTVIVDKLFDIESYEQVHQMVSTVSCEVKENTSFNDIVNATFPMASMTGAPKIRAMQLIDEYELYNRSCYSGALGYINANGNFDMNVLIRSIFYDEKQNYLSFTVGSAITALCDAEQEYQECLLKAKAMMEVLLSKRHK